jgi:hypothetical protein
MESSPVFRRPRWVYVALIVLNGCDPDFWVRVERTIPSSRTPSRRHAPPTAGAPDASHGPARFTIDARAARHIVERHVDTTAWHDRDKFLPSVDWRAACNEAWQRDARPHRQRNRWVYDADLERVVGTSPQGAPDRGVRLVLQERDDDPSVGFVITCFPLLRPHLD